MNNDGAFGEILRHKRHTLVVVLLGRTLLGVITETADKYDWHTFSHWVFNGANKLFH